MKNKIIPLLVILAIGLIGLVYIQSTKTGYPNSYPTQTTKDKGNDKTPTINNSKESTMSKSSSRYLDYTAQAFAGTRDKKRVYFFHATWCPTCKAVNEEFNNNPDSIPEDVILFKTDYDSEKELKKKYGITYQHTFVYVDADGRELKKWNGGGIAELTANTRDN